MAGKPKLSIVTPVYHEEDNICKAIDAVVAAVKTSYEFLIIYDTKEDPTYQIIQDYVKKHKLKNVKAVQSFAGSGRGFLNALKSGFEAARGEAVVVMMSDLCDDTADIDTMYKLYKEGADIVCASRYVKGGKQIGSPLVKRTLSRLAGKSLFLLGVLPIHDVTNNFKLYGKNVLKKIDIDQEGGFEIAMQLTVKARKAGYQIKEVPTTWRDRTSGEAKFKMGKMLPKYLKWYWYALTR